MKTSQWSAFFFLCHNSSVNFSIVQLFIFCIFFFHVMLTISSQLKILSQDNHKNGTTLLLSCPYDTTTPIQRGYSLPYLKSSLQLMMKFACTTSWFKAKCFSLLGLWVMPSFSCIWSPQLNVCFYSAAPAWQASKGVGDRKERKKSGKFQFGGGGEWTTNVRLYGEVPPERGIFFRLQVYERLGKSVIWVCESTPKG